MRKELEIIQIIEKYLNNELSESDKAKFEERLSNNPELAKEVEKQRFIQEGVKNIALKTTIQKAWKAYKLGKYGFLGGMGLIIAIGISLGVMYSTSSDSSNNSSFEENLKHSLNEIGENLWADADQYLAPQFFQINADEDQVLQTESGITIAIPKGALLQNGEPVTGEVEIEFKEALNPEDIIQSGLTTMSGNELLETGGMFYLNARKNGENLTIDPNIGVGVDVPSNGYTEGMQLYDGVRKEDGSIDWQNPKPLEHFLTTVDILSLDFYPPGYENKLNHLGHGDENKSWKDSLYFSFGNSGYPLADEMVDSTNWVNYQINPSKIQTIWSEKYQNSLLATKEFEERLKYIFQTCDDRILDLYVNNLDKRMATIDSMVVELLCGVELEAMHMQQQKLYSVDDIPSEVNHSEFQGGDYDTTAVDSAIAIAAESISTCDIFLNFARQNKGRVENGDKVAILLAAHYKKQSIAFAQAAQATQQKLANEYSATVEEINDARADKAQQEVERKNQNYIDEYNLNLEEACRQLGIKKPTVRPSATRNTARVTSMGWKNIDRAVAESVSKRTTLDFKDQKGRTAKIEYKEITVKVMNESEYDRVMVYLLPDQLNSFQRIMKKGDAFKNTLNELISYNLMVVGYKEDRIYTSKVEQVSPKAYELSLKASSQEELKKELRGFGKKGITESINNEVEYQIDMYHLNQEKIQFENMQAFRMEIEKVIFPCNYLSFVGAEEAMEESYDPMINPWAPN